MLSDFGNVIWIHRRMKNYLLNCWRNLLLFFFFFFFFLFKGCLTFHVAHKSNIMWVVTYAQVAALSFSTSVSNIFKNQRVDKREWMPFHYSWRTFHLFDELSLNRCNQKEGGGTLLTGRCWKYFIFQLEFLYFSIDNLRL